MNISKELLEKAEKCKTAEEIVSLAKENGVTLTLDEANSLLSKKGKKELSEDEIDTVVAGLYTGGSNPDPDK